QGTRPLTNSSSERPERSSGRMKSPSLTRHGLWSGPGVRNNRCMPDRQTAVATRKPPSSRAGARRSRKGGMWRRGWIIAVLALLSAATLIFHRHVPNSVGNLGSLLDTFLPWVGVAVPVLAIAALVRRSATAGVALLVPALVWGVMFGDLLLPGKGS